MMHKNDGGWVFEELCLQWHDDLIGFATGKLTYNRDSATDLVQDAMLKALRAWATFQPDDPAEPARCARSWLMRIVHNLFVNEYHRQVAARSAVQECPLEIRECTYGTPSDGVDPREDDDGYGDEVSAALAALEPRQRELVVRSNRGDRYVDIAEDLGMPLGTVMSGLSRARKRLAGELSAFARARYGISDRRDERRSDRARVDPERVEAAHAPEPETCGVERIVCGDDGAEFGAGELAG